MFTVGRMKKKVVIDTSYFLGEQVSIATLKLPEITQGISYELQRKQYKELFGDRYPVHIMLGGTHPLVVLPFAGILRDATFQRIFQE